MVNTFLIQQGLPPFAYASKITEPNIFIESLSSIRALCFKHFLKLCSLLFTRRWHHYKKKKKITVSDIFLKRVYIHICTDQYRKALSDWQHCFWDALLVTHHYHYVGSKFVCLSISFTKYEWPNNGLLIRICPRFSYCVNCNHKFKILVGFHLAYSGLAWLFSQ